MRLIEQHFHGRDIRDIILDYLRSHRTDAEAVAALGAEICRPLNETILSVWIRRLNIVYAAQDARAARE